MPSRKLLAGVVVAFGLATGAARAETVIIGHFGDPTPAQLVAASETLGKITGWDIQWRKFAAGTDVIAAMASGDVVLSTLGSSPIAIAATQGVDLQMIAFDILIGEAESLIAREGSGVEKLEDLRGKRIAVPVGSTAHFSLMCALDHAGIGEREVTVMNMTPDQIAAAWEQGLIDAAWIWQPVQSQILKTGRRILGADRTAEWGCPTFNGWVVNREFGAKHREAVAAFLREIDRAVKSYLADPDAWTPDSEPVRTIARATGADPAQVPEILKGYVFVPLEEQLSERWLGAAPDMLKKTAEFLVQAGRLDRALDDYRPFVNDEYARLAVGK